MKSIFKSEEGKAEIINFYNNQLMNWQYPHQEHNIETSIGETFVIECGDTNKPAVVLLHGSGTNSLMWLADMVHLSEHFHVFALDIPGECGKSAGNRPDWKEGHYANWLNELFQKLNIDKASLIGNSTGGWVALDFSIRIPLKTENLILIATAGITPVKPSLIFRMIAISLMGKKGVQKMNKIVYGNIDIDETAIYFTDLVKEHYNPRTDVHKIFTDIQLQQLNIPVLFIGGENDCFYNSQKTADRLLKNCPKTKCIVLKDTDHVVINHANTFIDFFENEL